MSDDVVVRVFVETRDRLTSRLLTRLQSADLPLEIIDVHEDSEARTYVERLACCGRIYPVVEAGGLTLLAPKPREVLDLLDGRLPVRR